MLKLLFAIHRPSVSLILLVCTLCACGKNEPKTASDTKTATPDPSEAITVAVKALNAQDSAAFFNSLTKTMQQTFLTESHDWMDGIHLLKGTVLKANIISATQDSSVSNLAIVKYSISSEGPVTMTGDTVEQQVMLEDGHWKQQRLWKPLQKLLAELNKRGKP